MDGSELKSIAELSLSRPGTFLGRPKVPRSEENTCELRRAAHLPPQGPLPHKAHCLKKRAAGIL